MKIYTRRGDNGITTLYDGSKLHKGDQIFDALGDLDELSVAIGVMFYMSGVKGLIIYDTDKEYVHLDTFMRTVQRILLDIGSVIARAEYKVEIDAGIVDRMELYIDWMTDQLPPLKDFILPGVGNCDDVPIHQCRVVCRRVERKVSSVIDHENIQKFLNRLSDFFFTLARFVAGEDIKNKI